MNRPLISIIMAAYNAEKYVGEAMDSVLQQCYEPLEFITINDGSTDNTETVIKKYIDQHPLSDCIQFHSQENVGVATTLNRGIRLAQGQYLAFIDADDIWEENKLLKQIDIMLTQPDLDMLFGHTQQFYSPDLPEEERRKIQCPKTKQPALIPTAMIIKASSFHQVGPFSEQWRKGHFLDWFSKAQDLNLKYVIRDDIVFHRRLHSSNMGIYMRDMNIDYVRILKASLDRRRLKLGTHQ